jgi:HEAT repeat protein
MTKLVLTISLLWISILLGAQSTTGQERSEANRPEESPFVLKVTYKNYGKRSKHLVKVGVQVSNLSTKYIGCAAGISRVRVGTYFDDVLPLPANYTINLHISNAKTIIDADPVLAIPPDEARTVAISFIPSIIGVCTLLVSFEVSGILVFDDGEEVRFSPKQNRITAQEVNNFFKRTPDEAELLDAINNRNVDVRRRAFSRLPKSTLDSETLKFLIGQGLANEDPGVRAAAARSAGKLRYSSFTSQISRLLVAAVSRFGPITNPIREQLQAQLESSAESKQREKFGETFQSNVAKLIDYDSEIADYCKALGELQDPAGIDALITTITDLNFTHSEVPSDALIKLNHPEVINKVRPLLNQKFDLVRSGDIANVLIAYRDMKSVERISDFMFVLVNTRNDILLSLVTHLSRSGDKDRLIRDPFILTLRPALETAFKSGDDFVRVYSLELLTRMPLDQDILTSYLRTALKDKSSLLRRTAADSAGALDFKSLVNDIRSAMKSSDSNYDKEIYCKALLRLGKPCP